MAAKLSIPFTYPRHWTLAQRLDHYIDKSGGPDACWPWTGTSDKDGYGIIVLKRKKHIAHRVAWKEAHGPIPPDKPHILHRCDNPPCCNPAHLWTGTNDDNMADKIQKERHPRGERNFSSKLSEQQVREMRAAKGTIADKARRFGVHFTTASDVVKGKSWKHVR